MAEDEDKFEDTIKEEIKEEPEFVVQLTEEERIALERKKRRKPSITIGVVPRIEGPPLEDSGGFCMTEEKTVNIETGPGGDNFELISSTVNGVGLNIDYTDVPAYINVTDAVADVMRLIGKK